MTFTELLNALRGHAGAFLLLNVMRANSFIDFDTGNHPFINVPTDLQSQINWKYHGVQPARKYFPSRVLPEDPIETNSESAVRMSSFPEYNPMGIIPLPPGTQLPADARVIYMGFNQVQSGSQLPPTTPTNQSGNQLPPNTPTVPRGYRGNSRGNRGMRGGGRGQVKGRGWGDGRQN